MMKFKSYGLTALFFAFLFNVSTLSAVDYYVNAGTGDDLNNDGLTAITPFKTIEKAIAMASATVVFIESGDYSADSINITKNLQFNLKGTAKLGTLRLGKPGILLTLSGNAIGQLDISKTLFLDSGNVSANNSDAKLRLLIGAKQVKGASQSHVVGGYYFQHASNSFNGFTWHVGSSTDYRKIDLEAMSRTSGGVADDYYGSYIQGDATNVSSSTLPANKTRNISKLGYWFVDKTINEITTAIVLRFFYDKTTNDDQVFDKDKLQILNSPSISTAWTLVYQGASADRVGSIETSVIGSGGFGYYTLGNEKGGSNYQGGINTLGNTTDPFIKIERLEGKKCEEDTLKFRALVKNVNITNDFFTWNFGDLTAYSDAGYSLYNQTTVPANPDTLAFHVFRVAGSFLVSAEVESAIGGKRDKTNFPVIININPETNTDGGKWLSYESYPTKGLDTVSNTFVCQGQRFWVVDKYGISRESTTVAIKATESMFATSFTVEGIIPVINTVFSPPTGVLDTFKMSFNDPGSYKVIVTRETSKGCIAIEKMDIRIYANPSPIIDFLEKCETPPLTTINPRNNTLDPEADNKMVSWDWHYRGVSVINEKVNKNYVFSNADPNPNLVKLVVRTNKGCVDSIETDVVVNPKPIVNKLFIDNICFGEITDFDSDAFINFGGSIDHHIWSFNRDNPFLLPDTNKVTSYEYLAPALYKVRLRLVSDNNCITIKDTNLRIHPRPQPEFQTNSVCFGDTTRFRRVLKRYPREDSMFYQWYINYKFVKQDTALKQVFSAPGIYNVSLIGTSLVGCRDSAIGIVRSFPVPNPTLGLNLSIAGNDTFQCLNANRFTFNYDFGLDLYDTLDVSRIDFGDSTIENPAVSTVYRYATDDTFTVQLYVQNINGCADSVTQIVAVWPSPVADFSFEGICMPDSVTFVDTSSTSVYPIANRYWNFGDGKVDTGSIFIKHPYPNAGPYTVTLIVESSLGCTDTTAKLLDSLVDYPVTSWALVGGSMPICKSDSVIFEALGGDSLVWNIDGDNNAQKAFRTSGTYYFTAINQGKCSALDSVQVFAYTPTNIIANPDTVIYRGRQVNLYVRNAAFNIKWTPGDFLLGDSTKSVVKTTQLIDSIRFYVTALDSNGCPDLDSVTIKIIDPPLVKIPNIITPNGDNENETWNLIDIPDLFLYTIVISDRQGKRVYDSENYKNDWAATDFNGNDLPNGVYFYYMNNRQTNQLYRGYIQVIR